MEFLTISFCSQTRKWFILVVECYLDGSHSITRCAHSWNQLSPQVLELSFPNFRGNFLRICQESPFDFVLNVYINLSTNVYTSLHFLHLTRDSCFLFLASTNHLYTQGPFVHFNHQKQNDPDSQFILHCNTKTLFQRLSWPNTSLSLFFSRHRRRRREIQAFPPHYCC